MKCSASYVSYNREVKGAEGIIVKKMRVGRVSRFFEYVNDVTSTLSLAWIRDVPIIQDQHVIKVDKSQQQRMRIIPVHVITGVVALLACKTDWYIVSKNI